MDFLLGFVFLFGTLFAANGDHIDDPVSFCARLEPLSTISLNLQNIEGMWFVVETIHHRPWNLTRKGVLETCPVLQFKLEERGAHWPPYGLKMWWREGSFHNLYSFHIPDPSKEPGVWLTSGAQNVSLPPNTVYTHFAGTVEVLKAADNYMVLLFCTPGTVLYSVVLSRSKRLNKADLANVSRLLEQRRLHKMSVIKTCKGAAAAIIPSAILILLFLLFIY